MSIVGCEQDKLAAQQVEKIVGSSLEMGHSDLSSGYIGLRGSLALIAERISARL